MYAGGFSYGLSPLGGVHVDHAGRVPTLGGHDLANAILLRLGPDLRDVREGVSELRDGGVKDWSHLDFADLIRGRGGVELGIFDSLLYHGLRRKNGEASERNVSE